MERRYNNHTSFIKWMISLEKPVLLLEGKRKVRYEDQLKLIHFAEQLCTDLPNVQFRSGNAAGADSFFMQGIRKIDPARLQLILPYAKHRKDQLGQKEYAVGLDEINLASEPEIVYQTRNKKNERLIEAYLDQSNKRLSAKAPYLLRDTVKVIGSVQVNLNPINFAIFYDDLDNPKAGGTGHTMKICEQNNIPYVTQKVWFKWLK